MSERFGAGNGWRHSYERSIASTADINVMVTYRPDGRAFSFSLVGNNWLQVIDVNLQLSGNSITGWQLTTEDGNVETYDAGGKLQAIKSLGGATHTLSYTNGLLTTITHSNGRSLTLGYDGASRLSTLIDPAGGLYQYGYNATTGDLETVTYPDGDSVATNNPLRTYLYNEAANTAGANLPHALTGIVDENGKRFATFQYDAQRRANSTQHAGGAGYVGVNYGTDSNVVTDAQGTPRTHRFQVVQGVVKSAGSDQPAGAGCSASSANATYDANGNIASRTDFNGNVSCFIYDQTRNLEIGRIEGLLGHATSSCPTNPAVYTPTVVSSGRKTATQWHPIYRLPAQIDEDGRRTAFSYDANGNLLQKTITDTASNQSRSWTYTYNSLGQILTEDGPRTDVNDITTYTYYADGSADHKPGDLWKITNALGHATTFTAYDANGRLLSLTDPNGLVLSLAYDARGRLIRKTIDGNATQYGYDPVGNLIKVTRPSGAYYRYTYDAAHRLTDITDALGGNIHYTLDAMANRTQEDIKDAQGNLVKTHSRVYDALSRLQQDIGAYNQTTSYQYDANGNLTQITDANGHVTQHFYDSLNRLIDTFDAQYGLTDYFYDAHDRLTQVTDPNNADTLYSYNGFGDLLQLNSPNTGITQYAYDSAGNLKTKTAADNIIASYQYDALNRVKTLDYSVTPAISGRAPIHIENSYDGSLGGTSTEILPQQIGRLTVSNRQNWITRHGYDLRGNLVSATARALPYPATGDNTIKYHYDADDRLSGIAFSNYRDIQYQYDPAGKVSGITVHDIDGGVLSTNGYDLTRTVAANITHLPFGPVASLTYGNGLSLNRSYDHDYRLTAQAVGQVQQLAYSYDAAGNQKTATDLIASANSQTFGYDELNRLTAETGPENQNYSYDGVGNRLSDTKNGAETQYHYDLASQKLLSQTGARPDTIVTDAVGNITQSGGKTYRYGLDQQLFFVKQGTAAVAAYVYDAQGQRISKMLFPGQTAYYDYTPQGNLLAENSLGITANYIYLDSEPLARVDYDLYDKSGNVANWNIVYYHNDPIGAPLKTTNRLGQVSWTAQMDPFGKVLPINPNILQNLRFPSQYYDKETGLFYNMARYYDPLTGRYLQSDPIGLAGGVNTYTYVGNNPVNAIDPLGLASCTFTMSTGQLVCTPTNPQNSPVSIPVASGNNGDGQQCRNNPACTAIQNHGPIPTGCWQWTNGTTNKPNGRVLEPCPGTNTNTVENRTLIRSHSCANPFGPGLGPQFCSEGCVTGTVPDMQNLNNLIDAEPGSTLQVTP